MTNEEIQSKQREYMDMVKFYKESVKDKLSDNLTDYMLHDLVDFASDQEEITEYNNPKQILYTPDESEEKINNMIADYFIDRNYTKEQVLAFNQFDKGTIFVATRAGIIIGNFVAHALVNNLWADINKQAGEKHYLELGSMPEDMAIFAIKRMIEQVRKNDRKNEQK